MVVQPEVIVEERTADAAEALRLVRAQALIREVNEQIHRLHPRFLHDGQCEIICECVDVDCLSALELPLQTYENVRRFPTRFVVVPHHMNDASERVVDQGENYVVVEKVGPAAATAVGLDPRRIGHE